MYAILMDKAGYIARAGFGKPRTNDSAMAAKFELETAFVKARRENLVIYPVIAPGYEPEELTTESFFVSHVRRAA